MLLLLLRELMPAADHPCRLKHRVLLHLWQIKHRVVFVLDGFCVRPHLLDPQLEHRKGHGASGHIQLAPHDLAFRGSAECALAVVQQAPNLGVEVFGQRYVCYGHLGFNLARSNLF